LSNEKEIVLALAMICHSAKRNRFPDAYVQDVLSGGNRFPGWIQLGRVILCKNMARRRKYSEEDRFIEGFTALIVLVALGSIAALVQKIHSLGIEERWVLMGVICSATILGVVLGIKMKQRIVRKRQGLVDEVRNRGLDVALLNFIERFGREVQSKRISAWRFRDYAMDWRRLEDFRDELLNAGISLPKKDFSSEGRLDGGMEYLLKTFINEKERRFLRERVGASTSHSFGELNKRGDDFEHLIIRLSEAMGYASKRIGGVGDQGGDVIAARGAEQILIQAKCYTVPVGNRAVQEAVAARRHYGCTKATVMTTSVFTPEAKALAHSNAIDLVDRKKLQELLARYLHESWQ
jgi:hypothetical protein